MNFGFERVEAPVPDIRTAEARQKCFEWLERAEIERVLTLAAVRHVADEARLTEHAKVPADSGATHLERLGDDAGGARSLVQHEKDLAPNRISEGLGHGIHGGMCNEVVTRWQACFGPAARDEGGNRRSA